MSKQWFKAALIRALKTMAETAGAMIATVARLEEIGWIEVLSSSACSGLLSILWSIKGLPEVNEQSGDIKKEENLW